jgi:hypothetical protein
VEAPNSVNRRWPGNDISDQVDHTAGNTQIPPMSTIARFHNPFPGKPVPLKMSGLMQLCPTVLQKLMGAAPSTVQVESGTVALFKAMNRAQKTQKFTPKLLRRLYDLIPEDHEYTALFRAALAGDQDSKVILDRMGSWEMSYPLKRGNPRYSIRARIAIERAAMQSYFLASASKFDEAVDLMLADPLLSRFLWDEAAAVFRDTVEFQKLRIVQSSLVLETELSTLAALDAELCLEAGNQADSMFRCLLPGSTTGKANPVSLLFAWFKTEFDLKSIDSTLSHAPLVEFELAEATLKRWSSGTHCISETTFGEMVSALGEEEDHTPAMARHWAARVLNLIGYVGQHFSTHARALAVTPLPRVAAPWPEHPFGYSSFEEWCQARYPYWFDFHIKEIQRVDANEGPTAPKN